jgi:homoserine O-succinyltransferase
MPLIIEGQVPSRWEERGRSRPAISRDIYSKRTDHLTLALINNMPDPALEDTELQFFELLDIASGDVPVFLRLFSLTGVPRTDRGLRHLNSFYFDFADLWQSQFDGVIITGTEPHHSNLQAEPYWKLLTEVFDWAERNTTSTVLSCLAAHGAAPHLDGIKRHPLPDKQFGVFAATQHRNHELLAHAPALVRFPHSRWNEVRAQELASAGYEILTQSADAGVDLFVKQTKKSLFVHFQGHPEYGSHTLLKEYRRDIKRFLRAERETYPSMPQGYFDEPTVRLLNVFREKALSDRHEELIDSFPESVVDGLQNSWSSSAACVYQNWLRRLALKRAETAMFSNIALARQTRFVSASASDDVA